MMSSTPNPHPLAGGCAPSEEEAPGVSVAASSHLASDLSGPTFAADRPRDVTSAIVATDPDPRPTRLSDWCGKRKRPSRAWVVVAAVGVLAAAAVLAVATLFGTGAIGGRGGEDSPPASSSSQNQPPQLTEEQYRERLARFRAAILSSGVTDPSDLTVPSSAQSRALSWLVVRDAALGAEAGEVGDDRILQRYGVMTVYYSCGGYVWNGFAQPLEMQYDRSECMFRGVTCDDQGQVVKIQWFDTRLTGQLPNEIGLLTNLHTLDLSSNLLQGSIPEIIFNKLTNLENLFLNANEFTSTLSPEIANLAKLEQLEISVNLLSGPFPSALAEVGSLRGLALSENDLTGPAVPLLTSWPRLETFWAENTRLSGTIPDNIGDAVPGLVKFAISSSELTGTIPSSFGMLTKLDTVSIVCPSLNTTLPWYFGALTELRTLNFCRSAGSGTFPTEIGLLTKLTSLVALDNSGLRGTVPKELGNLAQLEILYLDRNDLSGTLPEELSRATNLRDVELLGNPRMSGSVDALCSVERFFYECIFTCSCCFSQCESGQNQGKPPQRA